MIAPSSCASCMCEIAASASGVSVKVMNAVPRFVMTGLVSFTSLTWGREFEHCLFIGNSRSRMGPYAPNISRRCASLTFLVSFSTIIYIPLAILSTPIWVVRAHL